MHAAPEHFASPHHGAERRAKPRHIPKTLAYVNVGDANGGVILDISETGMSIASAEPLEPNATPRLRFQLPRIDRTFELTAEMVWNSESRTKAGVRFVSMPIEERVQIRNWIKDELFAEAFPARVSSTMVPRRRLPFSFDTTAEAAAAATSTPRELKPHTPAKVLPDITVAIPSHTMAAFEKMFPSESTLGPQIVKRPEHARVAPSQTDIDTAALWMNFPSERDVAPRAVDSNEATAVAEDVAPPPLLEDSISVPVAPESVSEAGVSVEVSNPEVRQPLYAPAEEVSLAPVLEASADVGVVEQAPVTPIEVVPEPEHDSLSLSSERGAPVTAETAAPAARPYVTVDEPKIAAQTTEPAVPELTRAAPESVPTAIAPALSTAAFELPAVTAEAPIDEAPELPVHELNPAPEGPAFAASQMDAVEISQAVRSPGKFSGGSVSDASIESLLAIAEAEEASAPPPRKPLRVVRDQKPGQAAPRTPIRTTPQNASAAAALTPLPHVALRSAAQQSAALQNLAAGDKQFHGLLIAAAIVLLALCFVIGRSNNVQLPWMSKSSDGAPVNTAPVEPDPSAAPTTGSAPSPSSQITPDTSPSASQATTSAPLASDGSQSRLPDSASVVPSSKFEAPALPATPESPAASYFPVTAPAEGSAPRMVQLPEKTVFDSPKVMIQLRQYFYIPPQPGPEWSHKLGQILIGEPVLKMPPPPASDVDSSVVHVRATFGKDGVAKNVRPIDGPVALLPRSIDAVRQWRYQPSVLDGQPIEWQGDFTIEFRPAS